MFTDIPYICEGEIVEVNTVESSSSSAASGLGAVASAIGVPSPLPNLNLRQIVSYTCRVTMPEGEEIMLTNVIEASLFGGIDDYMQIRRRASRDNGNLFQISEPENMDAHIGDRVYIAFVSGSIFRPIIIGFAQHPNQVPRFETIGPDVKPQAFMRYLGMDVTIDEDGQFFMTHFGAPKIKYTGSDNSLSLSSLENAIPELPSIGGNQYKGFEEGEETLNEPENDAVEPQSFKFKTIMEMLKDGTWRVRDSLGQMLWVDPKNSQIYLANNGVKSTDPLGGPSGLQIESNSTDSEYVLLDRKKELVLINARKIAQIYSFGRRKDVTDGDYSNKVHGGLVETVDGDYTQTIGGSITIKGKSDWYAAISGAVNWKIDGDFEEKLGGMMSTKVGGDFTNTISGAMNLSVDGDTTFKLGGDWGTKVNGDFVLITSGDIRAKTNGGAAINASGATIELGAAGTGVLNTIIQLEKQVEALIDALVQLTVTTVVGPSGPPINAAQLTAVKTQMTTITQKLEAIKGSL